MTQQSDSVGEKIWITRPGHYKIRRGDRVYVAAIVGSEYETDYPVIGFTQHNVPSSWAQDGRCMYRQDTGTDIVAEWPKPVEIVRYQIVCAEGVDRGRTYNWAHSLEDAQRKVTSSTSSWKLAIVELKGVLP